MQKKILNMIRRSRILIYTAAIAVLLLAGSSGFPASARLIELEAGGAVMTIDTGRGARIVSLRRDGREMLLPDSVNARFYGATMWVSPQRDYWPERPALDREPYELKAYRRGHSFTAQSAVDSLTGLRFVKTFAVCDSLGGFDICYTVRNEGASPRRLAVWDVARVREGVTYFPIDRDSIAGCRASLSGLSLTPSLAIYRPRGNAARAVGEKFYATAREPWIAHRFDGMIFVKTFEPTPIADLPPLQGEVEIFSAPGGRYVEIENHGPYTLVAPGAEVSYRQRWYLHEDYSEAPLEDAVGNLLRQLTPDEKLGLIRAESKFASGGVPRFGLPTIEMSDGPHGIRAEFERDAFVYRGLTGDSATVFPSLTALAATWNRRLARDYGEALGEEAAARGKDVVLGPGLNICRSPLGGRNFEYMGEDPLLAGEMSVPYIQGIQSRGVAACAKHFAVNNQETLRTEIDVRVSDRTLRAIYLPAFRRAVTDGGVWTVMGAYNKVNGQYACHNGYLLNDILKGEWGFDGAVISDWGGTHSTTEAALNGLDIEMATYIDGIWTHGDQAYGEYYLGRPYRELLESGALPMSGLDGKAARVLRLRLRTLPWLREGSIATDDHMEVARRVAAEGIVLLKNDAPASSAAPLLPLAPGCRLLVVGDNAVRRLNEGGGSSELKASNMITPLDGLSARYGRGNVSFTRGYAAAPPTGLLPIAQPSAEELRADDVATIDSLRARAVAMAREADVVIFCGGLNKNRFQDCESDDRLSFDLPFHQNELLEAILEVNPNVVTLLFGGNAVALPMADRLPAVLELFYPGSMGGEVLADIIAGDINPSGRLPFTFPKRLEDVGAHSFGSAAFPGDSTHVDYLEEELVGYRWHDAKGVEPLFPFGHGLSYTTFDYGEPMMRRCIGDSVVTAVEMSFVLTNSGPRDGSEVVMAYGVDAAGIRSLAAFDKIELGAGESRRLTMRVPLPPGAVAMQLGPHRLALRSAPTDAYIKLHDAAGTHPRIKSVEFPGDSDWNDAYNSIYGHGAVIENPYVAYRVYMDARQSLDLYVKRHPGLELDQTGFYTTPEQMDRGYGCDVLWAGASVAAASFRGCRGGVPVLVDSVGSRRQTVISDSVVEICDKEWIFNGHPIDMTQTYSVSPRSRALRVEIKLKGHMPDDMFCTGVQKLESGNRGFVDACGVAASWGSNVPDKGRPQQHETVGLGIVVDPANIVACGEDELNYLFFVRPDAEGYIRYRVYACGDREEKGFSGPEEWFAYVRSKYRQP